MLVLLHLFALFLLVLLGFYVFVANPRNRAHQTFAAFIAFLALWTVKDLIFWNFRDESIPAGWWASSSFIIALLMQSALAIFSWVFPENSRTPKKRASHDERSISARPTDSVGCKLCRCKVARQ